ncbi:MAG: mechanosensitive ion channel family protein, partial [Lachnospiraceae bacterium]|nr:mechanosensitive ion channel family protein [Lachnospiraceae bacterium]
MDFLFGFIKDTYTDFNTKYSDQILNLIIRIGIALVVIIIGILIIRFIKKLINRALSKVKVQNNSLKYLVSVAGVILYIILGLLVAAFFGIDATSIVALLGSAGVTIGLALQGSLSNMAGGVLILILEPFKIGDYIVEDNNKNEGTVTEIGLFYTKLQTLDERTVILPNGTLANTSLTNMTATPTRHVEVFFEISY